MILRAKTKTLFSGKELTSQQQRNTDLNIRELEAGKTILTSYPRRLVFELTNACNLNCHKINPGICLPTFFFYLYDFFQVTGNLADVRTSADTAVCFVCCSVQADRKYVDVIIKDGGSGGTGT